MERELLLLGLLRRQEMHGYQLHDFIDSYMQICVDLKKSTAYYLLEKMEKEGYVTQTEGREGNRPPRRVYQLTAVGENYFQSLLRQNLAAYLPARFPGDTGLSFLDNVAPAEAIGLLQERRTHIVSALGTVAEAPPHAGSLQYLLEHQRIHLQSELAWLDELLARLYQSDTTGTS